MTTKKPTHSTALYIPAGFYLLRTPVLPANVYTRLSATSPQHDHEAVTEASCYQLLHELVEQPQIRLAVAVASPSLLESIERLRAGKASAAQAERTYKGVLRYLIRMSSRPTPFGLFAGVALGTFTGQTSAQLALPPIASTRTRTDMGWLLEVIQKMEQLPELVHQLRVRSNQTTYIAGGRLLLPRADIYGQQDGRAISLRATPVVLKTVQLAQHGIPYPELVAALQATYPQATTRQIEQMLSQLWDHHILIGELHPPLNEAQPARYLAEQLASVHGIDQVKTALEEILVQSAELDEAGANAPLALLKLKKLERSQAQLVEDEKYRPVQIDTALRLKAAGCHQHIAEAAAQAAELLLRMTPLPQ
ncbi:MAG: lantibiotic dehydratase, partial [Ktedonobacteraceae bacterium]|nr:lantibiotic dehydratase [Ktedonobacteraceae bacterium]